MTITDKDITKPMNLFQLRISGWDGDASYHLLLHPNKTQEEFEKEVTNLLREKGEEFIKQEECYIGNDSWLDYIVPFMINDLGYTNAEIKGLVWQEVGIIRENNQYSTDWFDTVGEQLFSKAAKRNRDIEYGMEKPLKQE